MLSNPSLVIKAVAKVAAQEFFDSILDIDLDWEELALYLALTQDRQELINQGLGDVTHTRIRTRGKTPVSYLVLLIIIIKILLSKFSQHTGLSSSLFFYQKT